MTTPMPPEIQNITRKSNRLLLTASSIMVLLIVAAVGTYVWYFVLNPCEVQVVEDVSVLLGSQLNRYEDVYQVAISASPTSVVLPVSVLQQVLMDTQQVAVPSCMQAAKNELVQYMKSVIHAFDAY